MEAIKEFFANFTENTIVGDFLTDPLGSILPLVIFITRLLLPVLAVIIVARCGISLLRDKNDPETWGWLGLGDGVRVPVQHWENIIGRGSTADIVLPFPSVSRNHAALIREEKGGWRLTDIAHKHNILVNGQNMEDSALLHDGDVLEIAECKMSLAEITPEEEQKLRASRTVPGKVIRPSRTLAWLTLFLTVMGFELTLALREHALYIIGGYGLLIALIWVSWILARSFKRTGFEIETLGFFLSGIGLAVVCSNDPTSVPKAMAALVLGLIGFFFFGWVLRDMSRIKALRWPAAALAVGIMLVVLVFGQEIYGARNWISLGGFTIQPSELVKVLFVFAGGATLDRLFARRNLFAFIAMSAAIVGMLALISDFGTAAVFFAVYIVIAYLRSGDIATIALSVSGAVLAVVTMLLAKPYVADRFSTWRHAWDFVADGGYQQTRAMTVTASGGMFGLGGGQGWLKYVGASETDLVFSFVCEEWGFIIAFAALAALIIIALFAVRSAHNARSSYFVVTCCGTAALLLFQTMLNVGGSLDLLPFTGVTFPFVSSGGSSMLACWCLLAFLKAADTRQNASFAIKLQKKRRKLRSNAPVIAPGPVPAEGFPVEDIPKENATDAKDGVLLPGQLPPKDSGLALPGEFSPAPQPAPAPGTRTVPQQFPGTPPRFTEPQPAPAPQPTPAPQPATAPGTRTVPQQFPGTPPDLSGIGGKKRE